MYHSKKLVKGLGMDYEKIDVCQNSCIREIYDMQANKRKETWFNMQKLMVNNYALGILVLKVTTTPQDSHFDRITESHHDRPTT
jgi:hypothetical protein